MFLEKTGFPFEDAKFDPEAAISIPQQDKSVPLKPVLSDVPEHSAGLNISVGKSSSNRFFHILIKTS